MTGKQVGMGAAIAGALITDGPLSIEQLEAAYRHYKQLSDLLLYSGPRFGEAREEAVRMGNVARARIQQMRHDAERKRLAEGKQDDGLEVLS